MHYSVARVVTTGLPWVLTGVTLIYDIFFKRRCLKRDVLSRGEKSKGTAVSVVINSFSPKGDVVKKETFFQGEPSRNCSVRSYKSFLPINMGFGRCSEGARHLLAQVSAALAVQFPTTPDLFIE
jgi:hypothetical protein